MEVKKKKKAAKKHSQQSFSKWAVPPARRHWDHGERVAADASEDSLPV